MNAKHGFRRYGALGVEALCPAIILALVIDSARRVVWNSYTDRDVQIYATIAGLWQHGFIPYRDLYDFKPPLTLVALRIGYALWGTEADSLRYVILIFLVFGACMMYLGLRRSGYLLAAPLAALGLVTLVVADPWHIVTQNTELPAAVWCAAAFGCAAAHQRDRRWWWAAGSGACVGLAALAKQPAALFGLPVVVQLWLWGMHGDFWGRCRYVLSRTALAAAGFAAVVGGCVLYFAWHGAATAFYEAVIIDGCRYAGVGTDSWSSFLWRPTRQILSGMMADARGSVWPFSAAVAIMVPLTVVRPSRWIVVTWLWLLVSYLVAVLGPREEWHYVMLSFPGQAIAVGIAFELAVGTEPELPPASATRRVAGAVLIALLVYGGVWRTDYLPHPILASMAPNEAQAKAVGLRIGAAAKPGDTLFLKDEPYQIYMYAQMPPMTRFIYPDSPAPGALAVWASALQQSPTFIVISHATQERMRTAKDGLEADLAKMVTTHYVLWLDDPIVVVYRRTDEASPPMQPPTGTPPNQT